jgi:hypothetical protein
LIADGFCLYRRSEGNKMRKLIMVFVLAAPLALLSGPAGAKGCLKGAAVGGVVGHVAGHHAVVGAAAGCIIEHHREKVKDKAVKQDAATQSKPGTAVAPSNL